MAFKFPKSVSEISSGSVLVPGYYRARLVKEPVIQDNRKKKDGLSEAEGAGQNLILKLRLISDDPTENGRAFTKYLPMPRDCDADEVDAFTGQPIIDRKMEAIVQWVEAFGGTIDEDEFDLTAGGEAAIPIVIEQRDGQDTNSVDFNAPPKSL